MNLLERIKTTRPQFVLGDIFKFFTTQISPCSCRFAWHITVIVKDRDFAYSYLVAIQLSTCEREPYLHRAKQLAIIIYIPARVVENITWLLYFFFAQKCRTLFRTKPPFIYLFTNLCYLLEKFREEAKAVLHGSKQGSKSQTQQIIALVLASCQLESFNRGCSWGKCWPPNVPKTPVYVNTSGLGSACIYP